LDLISYVKRPGSPRSRLWWSSPWVASARWAG